MLSLHVHVTTFTMNSDPYYLHGMQHTWYCIYYTWYRAKDYLTDTWNMNYIFLWHALHVHYVNDIYLGHGVYLLYFWLISTRFRCNSSWRFFSIHGRQSLGANWSFLPQVWCQFLVNVP